MDEATGVLVGFMAILALTVGIPALAHHQGYGAVMQQAYDRGYAVQCIGKTGYYWECEK